MKSVIRRLIGVAAVLAFALCVAAVLAVPAGAVGPTSCHGTQESPGHLAGTINNNVAVTGVCFVNDGPLVVNGNLTVEPGATLIAAFGAKASNLTIHGSLAVASGATVLLGCNPVSQPCNDDNQEHPTFTVTLTVTQNVTATNALGVIVHSATIGGRVAQYGGGGGFTCDPSGVFTAFGSPVFSTYEDSSIAGNLEISHVTSCWLGTARVQIGGSASYVDNRLKDPDAIEILSNHIHGNLSCEGNSMVWDSTDLSNNPYPRMPQPNTVDGTRSGQCVLASPHDAGAPPGPGPF